MDNCLIKVFNFSEVEPQKMTLAEALSEKRSIKTEMESLRKRIKDNAKFQEGDAPAEDPLELIKRFELCSANYLSVSNSISKCNHTEKFQGSSNDNMKMIDAINARSAWSTIRSAKESLYSHSLPENSVYSRSEVKFVSAAGDRKALQKEINEISKNIRKLDHSIQLRNFQIELTIQIKE